jgi:putative AbiEi antitoxin of type IV toxin-antitoxin system/uncharacterized protein DUF559
LAGQQHGVVTRRQLLGLGFGRRSIEHRIERGRLHPIRRGVYAVGWPQLSRDRRWMAAVLGCEPGAALSHRSAAVLWGIIGSENSAIDVSVRRRCELRPRGLRVRSRPSLRETDVVRRNWIPLTSPLQTMVDLATELKPLELERAVNDADKRDVIHVEPLRVGLDRYPGTPGVKPLRELIDRLTFTLSDSELEVRFRPIVSAAGLPQPLSKRWVNGFEVDFHWPELGLVVETDGARFHRTPSAQTRDARRDRAHVLAGMTPLRFTHHEVRYERRAVRDALAAAHLMLRSRNRI